MDGLRKALAQYALSYANTKMEPKDENSIAVFKQVGTGFVRIVLDEPNLFRFLYTIVYTYGIVTLVAIGVIKISQKEVMKIVNSVANAFLTMLFDGGIKK